jgi:hypothetical protein
MRESRWFRLESHSPTGRFAYIPLSLRSFRFYILKEHFLSAIIFQHLTLLSALLLETGQLGPGQLGPESQNHGGFASNPIRPRVVSPLFPFRSGRFASIFFSKCKYSVIVKVLCFHT